MTGWGRTTEEGEAATTLQKAHIPVVTDTKCRQVRTFLMHLALQKKEVDKHVQEQCVWNFTSVMIICTRNISDNNIF